MEQGGIKIFRYDIYCNQESQSRIGTTLYNNRFRRGKTNRWVRIAEEFEGRNSQIITNPIYTEDSGKIRHGRFSPGQHTDGSECQINQTTYRIRKTMTSPITEVQSAHSCTRQ